MLSAVLLTSQKSIEHEELQLNSNEKTEITLCVCYFFIH